MHKTFAIGHTVGFKHKHILDLMRIKSSIQRFDFNVLPYLLIRAVGRSENPGVPVLFGGHNLSPLVEVGLTDLPKSGGAMVAPEPPGITGLLITLKVNPNLLVTFTLQAALLFTTKNGLISLFGLSNFLLFYCGL